MMSLLLRPCGSLACTPIFLNSSSQSFYGIASPSCRYVAFHPALDQFGKSVSYCVGCRLVCYPFLFSSTHTNRSATILRRAYTRSLSSLLILWAGATSVCGKLSHVKMQSFCSKFSGLCAVVATVAASYFSCSCKPYST